LVIRRKIKPGQEIIVTKRGKPLAKITALGAKRDIRWPNFLKNALK
jgi:antitoxin (DNA-binding transcriptional repressor) of toxin-antitoxin stability system